MSKNKLKFPCHICEEACKWGQQAIACNGCSSWYHTHCLNMDSQVYDALANTSEEWHCLSCGLPNFHSSLFEDSLHSDLTTRTSFSSENDLSSQGPASPDSVIGPPLMSSSPTLLRPRRPLTLTNNVRVVNINFRSIRNKKAEFLAFLVAADPDIVMGTETWLTGNDYSREYFPEQYEVYRTDRVANTGGGVLLAIKTKLMSYQVNTPYDMELVVASFKATKHLTVSVACCYRPPNSTLEYSESVASELFLIQQRNQEAMFLLGGDFNLPDINWEDTSIQGHQNTAALNNLFINTFEDIGLEQIVSFPTRFNPDHTLDLLLTNRPSLIQRCEPLPGMADHAAVLAITKLSSPHIRPAKRKILLWKRADMEAVRRRITTFNASFHDQFTSDTPIQELWSAFSTEVMQIMTDLVPTKWTTSRYNQPWITTAIKRLSRRKKKAFIKYRATKRDKDKLRLLRLEKEMTRETRRAFNTYLMEILDPTTDLNAKRLYSYVKSQKKDSSSVGPLRDSDGQTYSSPEKTANILNDQFSSVFNVEDDTDMPELVPSPYDAMPPIDIHVNGVAKLLRGLKAHKATGPDEVPARLLKEAADQLAPILTTIFRSSYQQATVPEEWRKASVVPIFKKGDHATASNYRPVSLTSICSKVMEHIVSSQIMRHLDLNNILSNAQHGFRKRRSCESQLILSTDDLLKSLDGNIQTDAILLDFAKAFDKVAHKRLLLKLEGIGISGYTLGWIASFLEKREQTVVIEGTSSRTKPVTSGVPQGTVLGPVLFLVYINDLPGCAVSSTTRLFADDCLIYKEIRTPQDAADLQSDLDSLQQWERQWLMSFHPQKCQLLRITRKKSPIEADYSIHGHILEKADTAKYLGVSLHKHCSWSPHIHQTAKKANNTRAFLQRNLRMAQTCVKKQAYESLVRPILEYSGVVWDPHTAVDNNKLEMVQRRYARYMYKDYGRTSSVTSMLKNIGWEQLEERRAKSRVTMLYRIINDLVDIPDDHLLQTPTTRRSNAAFRVPYARTLAYQRSFFPDSVRLWNGLSSDITAAESLGAFKNRLSNLRLRG